jgi:hypothetical protein
MHRVPWSEWKLGGLPGVRRIIPLSRCRPREHRGDRSQSLHREDVSLGAERTDSKTSLRSLVMVDVLLWIDLPRVPACFASHAFAHLLGNLYVVPPQSTSSFFIRKIRLDSRHFLIIGQSSSRTTTKTKISVTRLPTTGRRPRISSGLAPTRPAEDEFRLGNQSASVSRCIALAASRLSMSSNLYYGERSVLRGRVIGG